LSGLRARMQKLGMPGTAPSAAFADLPDEFILRVALNGKQCFVQGLAGCQWLDSQNAIESLLPDFRVTQTEARQASPLLFFGGKALGR
jgi:hypothetical protein